MYNAKKNLFELPYPLALIIRMLTSEDNCSCRKLTEKEAELTVKFTREIEVAKFSSAPNFQVRVIRLSVIEVVKLLLAYELFMMKHHTVSP